MKKAFMSLKFHDGDADKKKVEALSSALEKAGIETVVMSRDVEKWGQFELPMGIKLMPDYAFPAIQQCDMLIVEFSEKGVGLGIGAGFAFANDIPIYVIAKSGSDISLTMENLAREIIFYNKPEELTEKFQKIVNRNLPPIILASKSAIRKELLQALDIPFDIIVSDVDETPNTELSLADQISDIAMRKALKVLDLTKNRTKRLIIAADQNIYFDGVLYGKPKTNDEAKKLIQRMRGSNEIYAYVGNALLLADKKDIIKKINISDISRMKMDNVSDSDIDSYISSVPVTSICGGINITKTPFLHLVEGKMSTANAMTTELIDEILK